MRQLFNASKNLCVVVAGIVFALLSAGGPRAAAQESLLYSFGGTPATDPNQPNAGLVADAKGNLYGTATYGGGSNNAGAVFELSPVAGGGWSEKEIYNFCSQTNCSDGYNPRGSLVFDKAGNLYGTTSRGGVNNGTGTIFELSPTASGFWTEKTLFTFAQSGTTGAVPLSNLIFDSKGNLYGTAYQATGNGGCGVAFELSPTTTGSWTQKVLHTFTGQPDGCGPLGGLIFDAKGNLYGTTTNAGNNPTGYAEGTVYELSPATDGTWTEKLLYTFTGANGSPDGNDPKGSLIFDSHGNLYGTTQQAGGRYNAGIVFELSPTSSGPWTEKILYSFQGQPTDGSYEIGNLIFDAQGNLYGISSQGGAYASGYSGCSIGCGTVFELSPTTSGLWTETILHDFGADTSDGHGINGGILADAQGNLYGTSTNGGAYDNSRYTDWGTVWEVASAGPITFSPGTGTYVGTHTVAISSGVKNAVLYYTTDGTTPTTASNLYTAPIRVTKSETIKAFATATGYPNTGVASANYVILQPADQPVLSPAPGSFTSIQTVSIADGTANAVIYYTLDGSSPNTKSNKYTAPFQLSATTTVKAVAVASGYAPSSVVTGVYTINLPQAAEPTLSPAPGTFTTRQTVAIADTAKTAVIYYTTDGTTPTSASNKYTAPILVTQSETIQAIAIAPGYQNSKVASGTYVIETPAATPAFSPAAGTYNATQSVSITDTTPGAVIHYTTNGTTPTATSTVYTGPIPVATTQTIQAIAIAPNYLSSAVARATYAIYLPLKQPVISLASGTYSGTQTVTVTDASTNASLFYTTNGSTPTASSTRYTGPISVTKSETLKVIALATGYPASPVASATYTIK